MEKGRKSRGKKVRKSQTATVKDVREEKNKSQTIAAQVRGEGKKRPTAAVEV